MSARGSTAPKGGAFEVGARKALIKDGALCGRLFGLLTMKPFAAGFCRHGVDLGADGAVLVWKGLKRMGATVGFGRRRDPRSDLVLVERFRLEDPEQFGMALGNVVSSTLVSLWFAGHGNLRLGVGLSPWQPFGKPSFARLAWQQIDRTLRGRFVAGFCQHDPGVTPVRPMRQREWDVVPRRKRLIW